MFCTNCGSQFEEGNAFCPNCGTKVESVAQPVAAEAPVAAPVEAAPVMAAPIAAAPVQAVPAAPAPAPAPVDPYQPAPAPAPAPAPVQPVYQAPPMAPVYSQQPAVPVVPAYATPVTPLATGSDNPGAATAALILGIVAIICPWFVYTAPASIVCGAIGMAKASKFVTSNGGYHNGKSRTGKILSLVGLIFGCIFTFILLIVIIELASY